ncbi:MAG TPA: hypothetical protein VD994_06865 [Prosthecobacter sp.]|nr:hypothetical protein [Prosthecobacter sp.]
MPPFRHVCLALLLSWAGASLAHDVPNMTVEADFARNRAFTLKINFDPRLFLSDQPTTLPPVPASWYQDQSDTERAKTHEDALAYLRKNLKLRFGEETPPLPKLDILAINGADSKPLTDETTEVHLLATGRGIIPGSAKAFSLRLGRAANAAIILVTRVEGQDATLAVTFPGETSQEFPLTGVRSLDEVLGAAGGSAHPPRSTAYPWMLRGGILLLLLITWLIFRRKWKSRQPAWIRRR